MVINIIKKTLSVIVNLLLTISNTLSLFGFTLIKKFNLNINLSKPKHEVEILSKTKGIKEDTRKILKNQNSEERMKAREKILKEIIDREIININNLNKISKSEYFIVIPKMYMQIGKAKRGLIFENGVFENSVFGYLDKQGFINLGKKYSPVYIKNRDSLDKKYQNILLFKHVLDAIATSLWKRDNINIRKVINKQKNKPNIRQAFYDKNGKLIKKECLSFESMIVSSLNINEENLTLFNKKSKDGFVLKVSAQEVQDVKLKEILLESGLRVFMSDKFPQNIQNKLLKNSEEILKQIKKSNFFQEINKKDLEGAFRNMLKSAYLPKYKNEFFRIHRVILNYI